MLMKSNFLISGILYWALFTILFSGAIFSRSSVMFSESFHQLFDSISLTFGYYVSLMITKKPDKKFSYGYHRLEGISSILNFFIIITGIILSVFITVYSLYYLIPVNGFYGFIISVVSLPFLTVPLYLLNKLKNSGINEKANFKHNISDTFTLFIVVITMLIIMLIKNNLISIIIDTVSSFVIIIIFIITAYSILKDSASYLLDRSPDNISEIENGLMVKYPGAHHLHVWKVCSHLTVATLHVTENGDKTLNELTSEEKSLNDILNKYGINHSTIQFEIKK